jgi:hypothetical protein
LNQDTDGTGHLLSLEEAGELLRDIQNRMAPDTNLVCEPGEGQLRVYGTRAALVRMLVAMAEQVAKTKPGEEKSKGVYEAISGKGDTYSWGVNVCDDGWKAPNPPLNAYDKEPWYTNIYAILGSLGCLAIIAVFVLGLVSLTYILTGRPFG